MTDSDALFAEVVDKYSNHVNPYLAKLLAFAGFGVEMHGEGCYVWDHEGKRFLDCLGGYGTFALGHRHPRVLAAVQAQMEHLGMSGKAFFSKPMCDLAEALAKIAPEGLEYSFFCSTGAEAVEAALKFAKVATGRTKIVSTEGGYHGKTLGALSVTGREKYRLPVGALVPGAVFVPYGDAAAAVAAIDGDTAAMIVEPIQGEGGIIVPPEGYLRAIREACDRVGALLIMDEVQTGIGRTGKMWGCDHEGVRPDLMTLAKQLGGGLMPLGACMGTKEVWDKMFSKNPLLHTSTFGGSPIACAAGLATIQTIVEEGLVERSRVMGEKLKSALSAVAARHQDLVSEVRGKGLMLGVEFRMDEVGELTVAQMLKRGLIAAYTLNNPRVMRFEPPFLIDEDQIAFTAGVLDEALTETAEVLAAFA